MWKRKGGRIGRGGEGKVPLGEGGEGVMVENDLVIGHGWKLINGMLGTVLYATD